ncbi:hypothetical protein J4727_00660 [Providencia rettgeri]|uniref:Uncharacterized protein n=1 Tax=Providencia rettgeri TaxID=587 RepID=A0A939N9W9_PRORE|nr:hypothetical protein [Providencia rettgeri]
MIAFDGSEEGERVIHRLIQVKLLAGRDCHLAMHGSQDSQLKKHKICFIKQALR